VISAEGVRHAPDRIEAIEKAPAPKTAKELQQWIGTVGWVSAHIPRCAQRLDPLQQLLNDALAHTTSRSAAEAAKIKLRDSWTEEHQAAFDDVKRAIVQATVLAARDPDKQLVLVTDASHTHMAAMLSQVPMDQRDRPIDEMDHQPLGFWSGAFRGSELRWDVSSKEGAAVVRAVQRWNYLLDNHNGFILGTDHANLCWLWNRQTVHDPRRHVSDRLSRWRLFLTSYTMTIRHVPGASLVIPDLLSRCWGTGDSMAADEERGQASQESTTGDTGMIARTIAVGPLKAEGEPQRSARARKRARRLRNKGVTSAPTLDGGQISSPASDDALRHPTAMATLHYDWSEDYPSLEQLRSAQQKLFADSESQTSVPSHLHLDPDDQLYKTAKGQIWVPDVDALRERLVVVAHMGVGHVGMVATKRALKQWFAWDHMAAMVTEIVSHCLSCQPTRGGNVIHRPMAEMRHATQPCERVHCDYLYVHQGESAPPGVMTSVLVMRDDFTGIVMLHPVSKCTAEETVAALMKWKSVYGQPQVMMSDRGPHFAAQLVDQFLQRIRCKQEFSVAHHPASNGVAERAVQATLKAFRAIVAEHRLPHEQWVEVVELVQEAVNATPSVRLNNRSPFEMMFGRPPMTPLAAICRTPNASGITLDAAAMEEAYTTLANCIEALHTEVNDAAMGNARSGVIRERFPGVKEANFALGDFVLVATPIGQHTPKLQARWRGPMRISAYVPDSQNLVYEVTDLVTKKVQQVHAERLRPFHDASLNVTVELRDLLAQYGGEYLMERIVAIRHHSEGIQIKVTWKGFNEEEATWEPISYMASVYPAKVRAYVRKLPKSRPIRKDVMDSYGKANPEIDEN
jgi:hypothetical protein